MGERGGTCTEIAHYKHWGQLGTTCGFVNNKNVTKYKLMRRSGYSATVGSVSIASQFIGRHTQPAQAIEQEP